VNERIKKRTPGRAGSSLYHLAFIRNCHRWLAAGYSLLDARLLATAPEPAITGELVRAMKEAKLRSDAPTWMIRIFVADDPPVNSPGRLGKRRRRVDMEFERSEKGATFHFHCEAKRLYRSGSIREYVGQDGLGMFLTGEYARNEHVGGMLGYVQTEDEEKWIARLRTALASDQQAYRVASDGQLNVAGLITELPRVQVSRHDRPPVGQPIIIYHTFLSFLS
jgi:hypothetical protein